MPSRVSLSLNRWSMGLGFVAISMLAAWSQSTEARAADEPQATSSSDTTAQDAAAQDVALRISESIDQLGSNEFARRERAAEQLMSIGMAAIPQLRELEAHSDPEVRLRAADLVRQLSEGDFQAKVDAFLSGEDVHFDGWEYFQARLGSSPAMREVFIDLTKSHPELVRAFEGTVRERTVAFGNAVSRVQQNMFVERQLPDTVDAIALILAAADNEVPISASLENLLLGVLRYEAGTKIYNSPVLKTPVSAVVGDWVRRSSIDNRGEIIWFCLSWDIEAVLPVAIKTLSETNDTETLTTALKAIARFGKPADARAVAKLLDDSRPANERGFQLGDHERVLISDVAMATIAMLHDQPLASLNFSQAEAHPKYSFSEDELVFPPGDSEARAKARAQVDAWLDSAATNS